jgi:hypothetical protein
MCVIRSAAGAMTEYNTSKRITKAHWMNKQVQQQLDELFSLKNSGGMRVFLFAKFYEDT